jgi:hypothetical protein
MLSLLQLLLEEKLKLKLNPLLKKKTTKKLKHNLVATMRKEDCFYLGKIAKNLVSKGKFLPI